MSAYNGGNERHRQLHTRKKERNKGLIALLIVLLLLAAGLAALTVVYMRYYNLSNYVSDTQVMRDLTEDTAIRAMSTDISGGIEDVVNAVLGGDNGDGGTAAAAQDKDVYNLLLVGVDRRDKSWTGNSDAMILISVNRKQKKIHMISFMRDLYADIPGYGVSKLNAACARGGCPLLVTTIEENYGVPIDNYVSVDFAGLIGLIDAIGGVQLEVTDEEADYANGLIRDMASLIGDDPEPHYFSGGGTCLCDGYQATAYSRLRFVGNNDYERTERQRTVMTKIMGRIRNMGITEFGEFAVKVLPTLTHNSSAATLLSLLVQVPQILRYESDEDRVPYDGLFSSENEILIPDMEATKARLLETIYGS